ncbi:MAG: hypothetical protein JEZ02_10650 [Desulfatibacillum sp.]|nr:hypothetical protein [Desulfatibacillum sp.]
MTMYRHLILLFFLTVLLVLPGFRALAQEGAPTPSFEAPLSFSVDAAIHPVDYLASYPVPDANTQLSPQERERLVFLFLRAAQACEMRDSSETALRTCSPLYVLLKRNFPEIPFVEREKGDLVFLADIAGPLSDYVGP